MKYYFGIVIAILLIIIVLMFFVLFKIYKLYARSSEEVIDIFENQELLSLYAGSKESSELSPAYEAKEYSDNTSDSHSTDYHDGVQSKQEVEFSQVQPDVKELLNSNGSSRESIKMIEKSKTQKNGAYVKLLLQYDRERSILKVILKHVDGKLKSKPNSSETYVDVQVSAYQFRTFRNPGYRRPARTVLKKPIEFHLDIAELKTSFLLIFLLRYDPFSRLRNDGEVVVKLSELLSEAFIDGYQTELSKEIMKSKQDFTAFIFRPR